MHEAYVDLVVRLLGLLTDKKTRTALLAIQLGISKDNLAILTSQLRQACLINTARGQHGGIWKIDREITREEVAQKLSQEFTPKHGMIPCRVCGVYQVRKNSGQRVVNGTAYIYVNGIGRTWHGYKCPDCHANRIRTDSTGRMRKKGRTCRRCGFMLPPNRYFRHDACTPKVEGDETFLYFL